MHIKGLIGVLLVAIGLVDSGRAADQPDSANNTQVLEVPAAEAPPAVSPVAEPATGGNAEFQSWYSNFGWRDWLIGSPCTRHVYAGAEFSALHISSQTGGRTTLSFSDTTAPGVATAAFNEAGGVSNWGYSPRVWLGLQLTNKWGVRGRYWRLSDSDSHLPTPSTTIPTVGTNFATFTDTDRVQAWNWDIEGVRSAQWGQWKADVFVGGRHASFQTESSLLAFGVFTTGNFVNMTLQNSCGFDGSGVTYGGMLRRQLGTSGVYLFSGVRGSNLTGTSNSLARAVGAVASSPSAPLIGAATVTRDHAAATLGIFEFQTGLDFEYPLQSIPANCFVRVVYEYQIWAISGLPTGGAGFGGTIGEITTNSFASAGLGGMTLQGITMGAGLTW